MEKDLIESLDLDEVDVSYDEVYEQKKKRVFRRRAVGILSIILIIALVFYVFISNTFKLTTVKVSGNNFLSDEDIIEYGNVHVNSSIAIAYLTEIEANIESHEIVRNAKVGFDDFNTLTIVVEEEEVLFATPKGVYLSSGVFVETTAFTPVVDFENFDEVEKKEEVLAEFATLLDKAPEVYEFISQISFAPDTVTEDRIMIVMRDTNVIYLSTDQISEKMVKYFSVVDSIFTEYGEIYGVLSFDKGGEFKPY